MLRDDQAVCGEIKAAIAIVIRGVAMKDIPGGPWGELVGRGGDSVRVTCTDTHTREQSRRRQDADWQPESSSSVDSSIDMWQCVAL
jgi:hypothetical protein